MRSLTLFLICVLACFGFAQGESPQLRKEVQQFYVKFDKAINTANFEGAFALMDPSFVAVDENGKSMDYKGFKAMVETMKPLMKDMKSKITVQQVQGNSQEVFAWITMQHSFSIKDKGAWKRIAMTEKFVETLKMTPGGWKVTYSQMQPKA